MDETTRWIIGIIISVFGGFWLNYLFGDKIRDKVSIKEKTSIDGDNNITNATIKVKGPLSFENRPVYITNTIELKGIDVPENLKDSIKITKIDNSASILTTTEPLVDIFSIDIHGSGTTTVSGIYHKPKSVKMAQYSVYVFCDECGETHPIGINVDLNDGPAEKASIGDTYKGRDLPETVATLKNNKMNCPKTGNMILQRDNNQVFLVPIG